MASSAELSAPPETVPAVSTEQALFELDLYGFTVLPEVLNRAEATELAALLDRADETMGVEYVYEEAYARLVPCAPALDDRFLKLIDHPGVLPVIEAVLGREIVLGSMNARIVRPGDPEQGLHSDIPAVHRRQTGHPIMLQAVWMIDGFTSDNGATRLVPGSHRAAASAPPKGLAVPHVVAPTGPAGSVLIFNGQCWHGGGANRSAGRRRAVFGHYRVGAWMRFQTDPSLYLSEERWRALTARQREIVRMVHGVGQKNAADYYADQPHAGRFE
ncbi:MAG: phytanoyl-CoA dioxygenase family protein [Novosphingobium sp.]|nr:phytanoyl-CoA dioxygenase family protein [Novosphingobium sp.]